MGKIKKETRIEVYNKFDGHCAYCGEEIQYKNMQVDHIIPQLSFVQTIHNKFRIPWFLTHLTELDCDHIDNLFPACRVCNKWKTSFNLDLFRSEIAEQIRRLNDYSSNYRMAKRYGLINETKKEIVFYFETHKNFKK